MVHPIPGPILTIADNNIRASDGTISVKDRLFSLGSDISGLPISTGIM